MYSIFEELLKKHNVTAYRVSKETGINTATFTSWKQGVYTPKQDKLQKIAEYFGVNVDYLMGIEEVDTAHEPKTYYDLNDKDERDIAKRLESVMNSLDSESSLAFHGNDMDDETRDLLKMALEHGMRIATETAKRKYTPKKHRK